MGDEKAERSLRTEHEQSAREKERERQEEINAGIEEEIDNYTNDAKKGLI